MKPETFKPFTNKNNKGACPNCDSTGQDPEKGGKCLDCNGTGLIEVFHETSGGQK